MTQLLYILLAVGVGVGSAVQVGLVGQMGRLRGPTEAAWISVLGTVTAMALLFAFQSARHETPNLPAPFNTIAPYLAIGVLAGAALVVGIRGLDAYMAVAGVFGLLYLFGASFLAPRIGIALFVGGVTAGTLVASVGLDHFGAFGGVVQRLSVMRVVGLVALVAGVVLIRSGR
jgi:transporter family-2 protein